MDYGRVTGSEKTTNKDSEARVLLLQVEISDPDDVQTVELFRHAGVDYTPPDGSNVLLLELGRAWKAAFATDDGIEPRTEKGEYLVYSSEDGTVKAYAWFKKSGDLELNGDDDNAVRYSKLEQAFNQLKADFEAHIHDTTATIGQGPTAGVISPPTAKSTADITQAKIDSIKVPSNG